MSSIVVRGLDDSVMAQLAAQRKKADSQLAKTKIRHPGRELGLDADWS